MTRLLKFVPERKLDGCTTLATLDPIPFEAVRCLTVSAPRAYAWAGARAYRLCHLLLVPAVNALLVNCDTGGRRDRFSLIPGEALYVPPMTWLDYAWGEPGGGTAVILASRPHEPEDEITERDVFDAAVAEPAVHPDEQRWVILRRRQPERCDNG